MEKARIEEKIQEIVGKIVKEYQPEKIILFGSWAWGESGPDSDVDLLVVKKTEKPRLERQQELNNLLFPRAIALDLLVYTPEEVETSINHNHNLFIEDIIRNGKILYSRSGDAVRILHQRPLVILTP